LILKFIHQLAAVFCLISDYPAYIWPLGVHLIKYVLQTQGMFLGDREDNGFSLGADRSGL
jgi:hypothetical protein